VACGNPAMEMPDYETSDAAADSQQTTDSQTVSEDADSSVLEEDSSVMENDGSDSSVSLDSSDAGSDSRATDAAREPNVLYRTSDGGYEGMIEFNATEIVQDGGVRNTIEEIRNHYRNPDNGDYVARIIVGGCSQTLLHRSSIVYENIYGDSSVTSLAFTLFFSCMMPPATMETRIQVQTCIGIVTETCTAVSDSVSKTVRVE